MMSLAPLFPESSSLSLCLENGTILPFREETRVLHMILCYVTIGNTHCRLLPFTKLNLEDKRWIDPTIVNECTVFEDDVINSIVLPN